MKEGNVITTGVTFDELLNAFRCIVKEEMQTLKDNDSESKPKKINYTRSEFAKAIGYSIPSVDKMRLKGKILSFREGRKVLIPSTELQKFTLKESKLKVT